MGIHAGESRAELQGIGPFLALGELVEQPFDPRLVGSRNLQITVGVESVDDAGRIECVGEAPHVVVVEVGQLVGNPRFVVRQRRCGGPLHGLHKGVHLLLVGLADHQHRTLPGVRNVCAQQQALHHRPGLRGVFVEVVLQLILAGLAHVGGVGRRLGDRGDTAFHAGGDLGRIARAALEAPHL